MYKNNPTQYSIKLKMINPQNSKNYLINISHPIQPNVYIDCGLLMLIILAIDSVIPLGIAIGVFYLFVVLISLRSSEKRFTIIVTAICTILVAVGTWISPLSTAPDDLILANRALSILAIWITAILALNQQDRTNELHRERLKYLQSIKEVEIRKEKLKILKATMRTVQDIIGNFLNNLHFFKLEIDKNKTLFPESINKLDLLIRDTSQRINKLGDLEEIREKRMAGDTIGIDYEPIRKR